MGKRSLFLAKAGLSLGLVGWLLRDVDARAVADLLGQANPFLLIACCGLMMGQVVLGAGRWALVLHSMGQPRRFRSILDLFWSAAFFAQALPGAVGGDAVRIATARGGGMSLRDGAFSVLIERIAATFGLVLFVAFFGLTGGMRDVLLPLYPFMWGGSIVIVCIVALAFFLNLGGAREIVASREMVGLAFLCFLGPLNLSCIAWVLAQAMGLALTFKASCVIVPAATLVASLPVSIAGWGVREAALVMAFGLLGIARDQALVVSLAYGLSAFLAALPGGVLFVQSRGGRKTQVDCSG